MANQNHIIFCRIKLTPRPVSYAQRWQYAAKFGSKWLVNVEIECMIGNKLSIDSHALHIIIEHPQGSRTKPLMTIVR